VPVHWVYLVAGFPLYDGFKRPRNRYDLARMDARAADSFVCRHLVVQPPLIVPTDTRTSFKASRNYRLPRQLVTFQKRFRLLELSLPEIRLEFDRNTSNAGMLQSGTSRLARCQEFHRLSMRRHTILERLATMPNIAQNSMPNNSQSDSIILWFCVRNTRHNPRSGVFMGQSGTWWWVNRLRQRVVGMGRVGDRQHQHLGNRFLRLYFLKSPRSRLAFRPTRARSTSAFRLGNLSRTVFHKTSRSIRS
jgi:hypothetical protein